MEEILASIRRIISEDDGEPPAHAAPPAQPVSAPQAQAAPAASMPAASAPAPRPIPPSLSTDTIDALFAVRQPEPKPAPAARSEPRPAAPQPAAAQPLRPAPIQPQRPAMAGQPAPTSLLRDARPPVTARAEEVPPGRPLLSPGADAAVNAAFGNLAGSMLAGGASRTLEDLVKEMLRPMLKAWLDTNLPPLVERLVRDEIERVSRGR